MGDDDKRLVKKRKKTIKHFQHLLFKNKKQNFHYIKYSSLKSQTKIIKIQNIFNNKYERLQMRSANICLSSQNWINNEMELNRIAPKTEHKQPKPIRHLAAA